MYIFPVIIALSSVDARERAKIQIFSTARPRGLGEQTRVLRRAQLVCFCGTVVGP